LPKTKIIVYSSEKPVIIIFKVAQTRTNKRSHKMKTTTTTKPAVKTNTVKTAKAATKPSAKVTSNQTPAQAPEKPATANLTTATPTNTTSPTVTCSLCNTPVPKNSTFSYERNGVTLHSCKSDTKCAANKKANPQPKAPVQKPASAIRCDLPVTAAQQAKLATAKATATPSKATGEQLTAQLTVLPNSRFGKGDRQAIYEYVAQNPLTTIPEIAKALNHPPAFIRSRVASMVADLKLKPETNAHAFTLVSIIKSVREASKAPVAVTPAP
jgi:hypothetical protein